MALKMSTAGAVCILIAISACLSVVHGSFDPVGPSGRSGNFSVIPGSIRSQSPDSTANLPQTGRGVSTSGGDSFLLLLGSGGISGSEPVPGTGNVSGNIGGSTSRDDSNSGFARSIPGANLGVFSGSQGGLTDSGFRPIGIADSDDLQVQRIVNVPGSFASGVGTATVLENAFAEDFLQEPVTITQETTVDVFKTIANVIYNSVPITLTEFIKTTEVAPTLQVISTAVDDRVFVATAPVTVTQTVTVTNTNTGYLYATEVSTDVYTVTHKAYVIRQTSITSTLQQTLVFRPTIVRTRIITEYDTQTVEQTVFDSIFIQTRGRQVFRPTIVRTRITTEYDTQTVEQTVFNTIVIQPRSTLPLAPIVQSYTQTLGYQQLAGPFGGQQNLFVRNPQGSGSGILFQQPSGQVAGADLQGQQLLNVQLPAQDVRQFPRLG